MITILVCVIGFILGLLISKALGNSSEAKIIKIIIVIALIIFAMWNEGLFTK